MKYKQMIVTMAAVVAVTAAYPPALRANGAKVGVQAGQEPVLDSSAQTLIEAGNKFFNEQQYARAIEQYSKALEIAPKSYFALLNRARAYGYLGKVSEAQDDFRGALQVDPRGADALFHYGYFFLFSRPVYEDAIDKFDRLIKVDPKYPHAYYYRGLAYSRMGKYLEAATDLIKAVELAPNNALNYFELGYAQARLGLSRSAVQTYTWAIQNKYSDPIVYLNRALLCFQETYQFDQALEDLNTYIGLKPQDASAYFLRGELLASMGQDSKANADWKKFESLGGKALPGYANRRRALFPNATFDAKEAAEALKPGTCTIVGQAFVRHRKMRITASGIVVRLFPVTPYLEQWHKMRGKKENKNTSVFMSREANQYGINARVNENGDFAFTNLKPGKYFMQTFFSSSITGTRSVYDGSNTYMDGGVLTTTNYYHDQAYRFDYNDRMENMVEIKKLGDSVKVSLRN